MRVRKYRTERTELGNEGRRILESSEIFQFASKVTITTMLIENPGKERIISELSGVPVRTLNHWAAKADSVGFDALKNRYSQGRPTSLTEDQKAKIYDAIDRPPAEYGYSKWTGEALRDYIARTFQCSLGIRQCQRLLLKKRQKG